MQNFISKTIKILETSSSVFSLVALFVIFALPIVLSFSISNSININDQSSLEIPSVVWIDYDHTNNFANDSKNVLGVSTQNSYLLTDLVTRNETLFEVFPKFSEKLDTKLYNLSFEHKGNLNKQQILKIKNIYFDNISINLSFLFETLNKNNNLEKNALRKLTLGNKEFTFSKNSEIFSYTFNLKPQEEIYIYLDLSNTIESKYKLELLVN